MASRGIAVVLALVGVAWWLSKREAEAAVKLGVEAVAAIEQAEALLANPTEAVAQNEAFVAAHPTAYSMIEQANIQIASGQASVGDILRFDVDKAYYAKYVAEGGIAGYEEFTTQTQYWTPEYEAAKQAAKDKELEYRVTEIEAVGTHYIEHMLETLTPGGWLYEGLAAKHPELAAKVSVEQDTVPEGWTATVDQLKELEDAGYTQDTEVYEKAVDAAYEAAASTASKQTASTGESHSVSWSSGGGYSTVSASEATSAYGWN